MFNRLTVTAPIMVAALIGTVLLVPSPAQAADEWSTVNSLGSTCNENSRSVSSSVPGKARANFVICWTDDLTDVRVGASAFDDDPDGYHAEARIRYQIWTGSGWSGWHYRSAAEAYGAGTSGTSGTRISIANQITANVQAAACLYNGDTLIDCDDHGWQ